MCQNESKCLMLYRYAGRSIHFNNNKKNNYSLKRYTDSLEILISVQNIHLLFLLNKQCSDVHLHKWGSSCEYREQIPDMGSSWHCKKWSVNKDSTFLKCAGWHKQWRKFSDLQSLSPRANCSENSCFKDSLQVWEKTVNYQGTISSPSWKW